MKKLMFVVGEVVTAQKNETKEKKAYTVYQVESMTQKGMKILDKVTDFENRGFKVGDKIVACVNEKVQLWQGKIVKQYNFVRAEVEKDYLAMIGANVPKMEKMKI
jgi:hypothetical protein